MFASAQFGLIVTFLLMACNLSIVTAIYVPVHVHVHMFI